VRTRGLQEPMLRLVGDGTGESGPVSSIFGPVSRGLTISPTTPNQQRLVLLNALVRGQRILASKSSRDLGMSHIDTTLRVVPGPIGSRSTTTDVD
jgi:hypothetical protein